MLAGILSTHLGTGDVNESLSTLFYHDHRLDFTAPNSYKGLVGFYLLFNSFDTGEQTKVSVFRASRRLTSRCYWPTSVRPRGRENVLRPVQLGLSSGRQVHGQWQIQPFFRVKPRRYRFRMVDTGPSRFCEFFLTDLNDLSGHNLFWVIANDGNLLPRPVRVESMRIGVAERTVSALGKSDPVVLGSSDRYWEQHLEQNLE